MCFSHCSDMAPGIWGPNGRNKPLRVRCILKWPFHPLRADWGWRERLDSLQLSAPLAQGSETHRGGWWHGGRAAGIPQHAVLPSRAYWGEPGCPLGPPCGSGGSGSPAGQGRPLSGRRRALPPAAWMFHSCSLLRHLSLRLRGNGSARGRPLEGSLSVKRPSCKEGERRRRRENSFLRGGGGCCRCQPRSPSRGHLRRPSRLGRKQGGRPTPLLPVHHLSPLRTHLLSGDLRGGRGERRPLCLAGVPSGRVCASGAEEAGRCGDLRVRVCRGLRGRRAGGGGCLPLPLSGGRPVCVSMERGTWGSASSSGRPGAGELPEAKGRFLVPVPTAPQGLE